MGKLAILSDQKKFPFISEQCAPENVEPDLARRPLSKIDLGLILPVLVYIITVELFRKVQ